MTTMPKEFVDIATVLGVPIALLGILVSVLSYYCSRRKERREYGIELEDLCRKIEMHGYKIFSEKFELITRYNVLAKEIETKKLLPTTQINLLREDSSKLALVAHSVDISEGAKTKSVSSYLERLRPVVEALKK